MPEWRKMGHDGLERLCGFGRAALASNTSETRNFCGTADYISPEMAQSAEAPWHTQRFPPMLRFRRIATSAKATESTALIRPLRSDCSASEHCGAERSRCVRRTCSASAWYRCGSMHWPAVPYACVYRRYTCVEAFGEVLTTMCRTDRVVRYRRAVGLAPRLLRLWCKMCSTPAGAQGALAADPGHATAASFGGHRFAANFDPDCACARTFRQRVVGSSRLILRLQRHRRPRQPPSGCLSCRAR